MLVQVSTFTVIATETEIYQSSRSMSSECACVSACVFKCAFRSFPVLLVQVFLQPTLPVTGCGWRAGSCAGGAATAEVWSDQRRAGAIQGCPDPGQRACG